MADRVVIPLPPLGTLDLPRDVFDRHLVPAAAPAPIAAPAQPPELLDAKSLEARTGVPASWWMTQARERRIPFRKLGRYVRFDLAEVIASDAFQRRAIPPGCTGSENRKGSASG